MCMTVAVVQTMFWFLFFGLGCLVADMLAELKYWQFYYQIIFQFNSVWLELYVGRSSQYLWTCVSVDGHCKRLLLLFMSWFWFSDLGLLFCSLPPAACCYSPFLFFHESHYPWYQTVLQFLKIWKVPNTFLGDACVPGWHVTVAFHSVGSEQEQW